MRKLAVALSQTANQDRKTVRFRLGINDGRIGHHNLPDAIRHISDATLDPFEDNQIVR